MSEAYLYDRESYLVAEGTPPMVAAQPNFDPDETPPPALSTRESSLAPSSEDERRGGGRAGRRGKTKPSQSDAVLLSQLDPNRPDFAKHALKHALDSESEAEEEDRTPRVNGNQMTTTITFQHTVPQAQSAVVNGRPHSFRDDVEGNEDFVMDEGLDDAGLEELAGTKVPTPPPPPPPPPSLRVTGTQEDPSAKHTNLGPPAEIRAGIQVRGYDTLPPPLQATSPCRKIENESLSPGLAKNMIHASEANPENTLTPIQTSPPRSHGNGSPEQRQTLPPLSTVNFSIDSAASPFSARSPGMLRASPANLSHFAPTPTSHSYSSPYSGRSPPNIPHPTTWRSNTSGSASTGSDYGVTSASTITSISTPSSAPERNTPHHFPTSATAVSDQSNPDNYDEHSTSPEHQGQGQDTNGVNGNSVYANGSFTCNVKGCTAAPFQTQYLLNSHMNVHSDTRPHFCPEISCPRGPGGQGFKRKNEMIRHGLVHTSPGYVCPFCPDQQHKYPRPDNLQRHVRVHHVDKDRDDPQLRDVLAQRPEGGSRGRRRRLGS